jgi:hypothetical protein
MRVAIDMKGIYGTYFTQVKEFKNESSRQLAKMDGQESR